MHELNVVQTHLFSTVVILFSIHRLISQYSPVLVKIHVPVCALRSLGHGCVQEVKNDINTVRFLTQTARFVS